MKKIRIYLTGGNHMDIKCKDFKASYNTERLIFEGYSVDRPKKMFQIDLKSIIAWQEL